MGNKITEEIIAEEKQHLRSEIAINQFNTATKQVCYFLTDLAVECIPHNEMANFIISMTKSSSSAMPCYDKQKLVKSLTEKGRQRFVREINRKRAEANSSTFNEAEILSRENKNMIGHINSTTFNKLAKKGIEELGEIEIKEMLRRIDIQSWSKLINGETAPESQAIFINSRSKIEPPLNFKKATLEKKTRIINENRNNFIHDEVEMGNLFYSDELTEMLNALQYIIDVFKIEKVKRSCEMFKKQVQRIKRIKQMNMYVVSEHAATEKESIQIIAKVKAQDGFCSENNIVVMCEDIEKIKKEIEEENKEAQTVNLKQSQQVLLPELAKMKQANEQTETKLSELAQQVAQILQVMQQGQASVKASPQQMIELMNYAESKVKDKTQAKRAKKAIKELKLLANQGKGELSEEQVEELFATHTILLDEKLLTNKEERLNFRKWLGKQRKLSLAIEKNTVSNLYKYKMKYDELKKTKGYSSEEAKKYQQYNQAYIFYKDILMAYEDVEVVGTLNTSQNAIENMEETIDSLRTERVALITTGKIDYNITEGEYPLLKIIRFRDGKFNIRVGEVVEQQKAEEYSETEQSRDEETIEVEMLEIEMPTETEAEVEAEEMSESEVKAVSEEQGQKSIVLDAESKPVVEETEQIAVEVEQPQDQTIDNEVERNKAQVQKNNVDTILETLNITAIGLTNVKSEVKDSTTKNTNVTTTEVQANRKVADAPKSDATESNNEKTHNDSFDSEKTAEVKAINKTEEKNKLKQEQSKSILKFKNISIIKEVTDERLPITKPVEIGDVLHTENGNEVTILDTVSPVKVESVGGEGTIYNVEYPTSKEKYVAKIYHASDKVYTLTKERYEKIKLMVKKKKVIQIPVICWPTEMLFNKQQEFVGYLMPKLDKKEYYSLKFILPKITDEEFRQKEMPNYNRQSLVQISMRIVETFMYLHKRNVLVGDVNLGNIMVNIHDSSKVRFVDCDSYQIEGYPCSVGTEEFTSPKLIERVGTNKIDYKKVLRNKEEETYAVYTLVFKTIMLSNPYDQIGKDTNQAKKEWDFPYEENRKKLLKPDKNYHVMWMNMDFSVRESMKRAFASPENNIILSKLYSSLEKWDKKLSREGSDKSINPSKYIEHDSNNPQYINLICPICGQEFNEFKTFYEQASKFHKEDQEYCPACHQKMIAYSHVKQMTICDGCGNSFVATGDKIKLKQMLGEKGYKIYCDDCLTTVDLTCIGCGKQFGMKKYNYRKKRIKGVRSFMCSKCLEKKLHK